MRRLLLAAAMATLALRGSAGALTSPAVLAPEQPGRGQSALLVVLPAAGTTAGDYAQAARAAQAAADELRLWVAVSDAVAPAADAVVRYEQAVAQARAAGYRDVQDARVVVAAWGDAVAGLPQVTAAHDVAGTVALGRDAGGGAVRVLAELDRSTRVVRAALDPAPLLVLPGAGTADLRGPDAGAAVGDAVEAALLRSGDLAQRLAADRLVAAARGAAVQEAGQVCAELQRTTADLAAADAHRLTVDNRVDADLMAPTPEGAASGDLGGFLYDKAELRDDGDTAHVVTNSHTVGDSPAAEVMCKTKSRSAVAAAVHGSHLAVDDSPPTCADFTRGTLAWAQSQVSAAARARSGGVTVLPDASKAAGPEWVFSPLVLHPADPVTGRWEVQSPALLTELSDTELDPTFAGNHYCKVLSPVRALELVLEDTAPPGT